MFERLASEDFAYLTTTGRRTGRPHRIEIWFALRDGRIYLLSGGGDRADWVRNIRKDGHVRVQVGSRSVAARAHIARAGAEDQRARELLDEKYMGWMAGRRLSSWARGATPVVIELPRRPTARGPAARAPR
ncbi:MAG TPA: nitroreductase family deazaflavin-dependent oxidoreductase [Candidatus Limnocylindria bacterium]|nr:nitroreductase family deazaflavin-dependent oxidoreductase [Candidatus Limnocylindria bacterium]